MKKKSLLLFSCLLVIVSCAHFQSKSKSENSKLFNISVNNKTCYIDKTGKVVVKPQFDMGNEFSEGLAAVSILGGGVGFIDNKGKVVIKPQLQFAETFSEGLAKVDISNRHGYIDKTGKYVWEPSR